jgi:SAM-dependent methyltransferase
MNLKSWAKSKLLKEDRGLGDTIHRLTHWLPWKGHDNLAAAVEWFAQNVLFIQGCDCGERRERLNSLVPYDGGPKVVIALPHRDDWEGLWATINTLRDDIVDAKLQSRVSILVINQSPEMGATASRSVNGERQNGTPPEGRFPARFCANITRSGVECRIEHQAQLLGTAPAKQSAFRLAGDAEWLIMLDCHVQLERGSLARTYKWISRNRHKRDLYYGVLMNDDRSVSMAKHRLWDSELTLKNPGVGRIPLIGQDLVWGKWAEDVRAKSARSKPFEIESSGGWCLASRVDAFVGYSPLLRGFGGEEGYTAERHRHTGGTVYCLPKLRGVHRFDRTNPVQYAERMAVVRNHVVAWVSLGYDIAALRIAILKENSFSEEDLDAAIAQSIGEIHRFRDYTSARDLAQSAYAAADDAGKRAMLFEQANRLAHIPMLRSIAGRDDVNHVVEFGTVAGASTIAILDAQPESLISYDENKQLGGNCSCNGLLKINGRTELLYRHGENAKIDGKIPDTDLLHINYQHQKSILPLLVAQSGQVKVAITIHGHHAEAIEFAKSSNEWRIENENPESDGAAGRLIVMFRSQIVSASLIQSQPIHVSRFAKIYHQNQWGSEESVSGTGSEMANTAEIRAKLPDVFRNFDIKSILDLPCGDFNWIRHVIADAKIDYIGGDIVAELIESNRKKYPDYRFEVIDLINDDLPKSDLVLVRDEMVHFPIDDIHKAITNIIRSGSRYLLATSFPGRENHDIEMGDWRPINLEASPFNLVPIGVINEGCTEGDGAFADKSLALFDLERLR